MDLKAGDIIEGYQSHNEGIKRKITDVRKTGYTWEYVDIPDKDFISENSNDPFFDWGWKIINGANKMKLKALSLSDVEQVRQWRNEQLEMLRTPFLLTEEMQAKFYHEVICNRQANARFWGIWTNDDKFIGMCGLENIQWENRLAEISLLLNPDNINYSEKALNLLLHEGFLNMNIENIYIEVYECNHYHRFWIEQANKFNVKLAILPNRKYRDGRYYDSAHLNFNKEVYLQHENTIS